MQILLAEDNEANRLLVRSLLEREGHTLDFAENGLIALNLCKEKKYDLILMDILMPVMDGVKALRRLRRSNGRNAQTPIFALTGYSSQADIQRYKQVGFDIVLSKPLKSNDLKQAWKNYLQGDASVLPKSAEVHTVNFEELAYVDTLIIGQLLISGTPNEVRFISTRFWSSTQGFTSLIHKNLSLAMRGQNEALSALRRAAHGIKGSAATMGLTRLSRIAATLQNAPPDKIGSLVLSLTETIKPSAQMLEQTIIRESVKSRTGSEATHFGDADVQTIPSQSPPSLSKSQSPHKILAAKAHQQPVQAP